MVKKFRRAAAGLDEQLPSDLRPPLVLKVLTIMSPPHLFLHPPLNTARKPSTTSLTTLSAARPL